MTLEMCGRCPVQVWGGVGCSTSLLLLTVGDAQRSIPLILFGMCTFLFAFSASYGIPLSIVPHVLPGRSRNCSSSEGIKEQCRRTRLQISMPKAWLQVVEWSPCAKLSSMPRPYYDFVQVCLGVWQSSQMREQIVSGWLGAAAVFWVLCAELFSMAVKAPASSAAMAVLFASGAAANFLFLSLHTWLHSAAFLVFAVIAGWLSVIRCLSSLIWCAPSVFRMLDV